MSNQKELIQKTEFNLTQLEAQCARTYTKLKKLRRTTKLVVSDHAIVRYMERVEQLPVKEVTSKLLCEQIRKYYEQFGDGTFPIGEGSARIVIKDGVIVTIIN